jgi:hypothetical protein
VRILSAQAFSNLARPYAAARAEARISSSFLFASFVHSFAFRRRNLRSCSSWVRAAYHSHWRTCSKHSAMVDMVVSDHGPCLIPVDQVTRTLRVWLRSVRLRQPRNTHRYPSRKRKSPSWATGASIPRECVARSEGHPPSSAMIMIQRTPSHPVPCWLRNYFAVTRQRMLRQPGDVDHHAPRLVALEQSGRLPVRSRSTRRSAPGRCGRAR